jgi:hypothetical protein
MKKFNLNTKRTYTGRDGVEKTQWLTVGTLTQFDTERGGMALELNMFPDTRFYVFEQKPREQYEQKPIQLDPESAAYEASKKEPGSVPNPAVEYPREEINPADIPF